jgi:hypothetical protein
MLAGFTPLALTTAPVIALLVWLQRSDRRRIEAGQLRADIHHAANRALGGESLLAIRVDHPTPWRRGHVHLSAPLGYEWLVGDVSPAVLSRLPDRYDMVIHCGGAA